MGSPDVLINFKPALRVTDPGVHAAGCGPNMWQANRGSATVLIDNLSAFRLGDVSHHRQFAPGNLIEGSPDKRACGRLMPAAGLTMRAD